MSKNKIILLIISILLFVCLLTSALISAYRMGVNATVRSAELQTIHEDDSYEIYFENIEETHIYR